MFDPDSRKLQVASTVSFDVIEVGDFEFKYATVEVGELDELVVEGRNTPKKPMKKRDQSTSTK